MTATTSSSQRVPHVLWIVMAAACALASDASAKDWRGEAYPAPIAKPWGQWTAQWDQWEAFCTRSDWEWMWRSTAGQRSACAAHCFGPEAECKPPSKKPSTGGLSSGPGIITIPVNATGTVTPTVTNAGVLPPPGGNNTGTPSISAPPTSVTNASCKMQLQLSYQKVLGGTPFVSFHLITEVNGFRAGRTIRPFMEVRERDNPDDALALAENTIQGAGPLTQYVPVDMKSQCGGFPEQFPTCKTKTIAPDSKGWRSTTCFGPTWN